MKNELSRVDGESCKRGTGSTASTDCGNSNNDERGSAHYPSPRELKRVREWELTWLNDGTFPLYGEWFAFIRSLWWMPDWGWTEYDGKEDGALIRVFHISTGGWSGNEDIIAAMRRHFICWSQTFYIHKRGGHYEFRIPRMVEVGATVDAVDPHAASTGNPPTRAKD